MVERQESSSTVYRGRVIEVRVDAVRLADGTPAKREVVIHSGSVAAVVVDEQERVLLVRQYRYPVGAQLWEIPAGRIDPGEQPAAAAARELAEEAGLYAGDLKPLLDVYLTPGYSNERMHIFIARRLTVAQPTPDIDERIEPGWYMIPDAIAMCLDGRIRDVKTIAGLFAAVAHGNCGDTV